MSIRINKYSFIPNIFLALLTIFFVVNFFSELEAKPKKKKIIRKSVRKHETKNPQNIIRPETNQSILSGTTKPDSICIKYSFIPGDTLVYRAVSQDSIKLDGQPGVVKERAEIFLVVCDSIGQNGRFYLSQKLVEYAAQESSGEIRNIVRTESNWIGKTSQIEVDSLGIRYSFHQNDTSIAALTPGGAFQPVWLPAIGESCKRVKESWLYESTDPLAENGYPTPIKRQTSMLRILDPQDTLEIPCNKFQYTQTAQGSVLIVDPKQKLRVNSIIAGFGIVHLGKENKIPIHHFVTNEIKLTIQNPNREDLKGKHFITTNYTLVGYRPRI